MIFQFIFLPDFFLRNTLQCLHASFMLLHLLTQNVRFVFSLQGIPKIQITKLTNWILFYSRLISKEFVYKFVMPRIYFLSGKITFVKIHVRVFFSKGGYRKSDLENWTFLHSSNLIFYYTKEYMFSPKTQYLKTTEVLYRLYRRQLIDLGRKKLISMRDSSDR